MEKLFICPGGVTGAIYSDAKDRSRIFFKAQATLETDLEFDVVQEVRINFKASFSRPITYLKLRKDADCEAKILITITTDGKSYSRICHNEGCGRTCNIQIVKRKETIRDPDEKFML